MPGGDGTGPRGQGAGSGKGLGPCGSGLRNGIKRSFGRGFGAYTAQAVDSNNSPLFNILEKIADSINQLKELVINQNQDKKTAT